MAAVGGPLYTDAMTPPAPTPRPRPALWVRASPWLVVITWFGGLVALGYYGQREDWSPGCMVAVTLAWATVPAIIFRTAVRNMFGPVFVYEAVRLGRWRGTIFFRLLYVLAVLTVLALMYFSWLETARYARGGRGVVAPVKLAEFATEFFYVFQALQYAVVVLLTPAYVAGCIADEKERKTLEFLLATDLSGHEIVFGKLAARVLTLLMYVFAGLPVVAFLQLFGGIDPNLLMAGTAAAVVTVVGLSALSIYFSVSLKKPRDAIAMTYLAVALFAVSSALLGGVTQGLARVTSLGTFAVVGGADVQWQDLFIGLRDAAEWVAMGNALYAVIYFVETTPGTVTSAAINGMLLKFCVFWGVVTVALLAYSVARLRAIALRQSYGTARRTKKDKAGREIGRWSGRPAVGEDAMVWKEVFADGGRGGGCLGRLMAVGILFLVFLVPVVAFIAAFGEYVPVVQTLWFNPGRESFADRLAEFARFLNGWARVATGVLGTLALLGAAVRGAGTVSGERDRDTWISLISTPLTVREMLVGKFLGVVLGLRRVYSALVLVWLTALVFGAVEPVAVMVCAGFLAVYVAAFAWLGILCSVTSRNTLVATVRAILAAAFFAGGDLIVGQLCCCLPLALAVDGRDIIGEPFNSVGIMILGATPPLVLGWLPMQDFENRNQLMMFEFESSTIGPLAPFVGLAGWAAFAVVLAAMSATRFAAISNRGPDRPPRLRPGSRP